MGAVLDLGLFRGLGIRHRGLVVCGNEGHKGKPSRRMGHLLGASGGGL